MPGNLDIDPSVSTVEFKDWDNVFAVSPHETGITVSEVEESVERNYPQAVGRSTSDTMRWDIALGLDRMLVSLHKALSQEHSPDSPGSFHETLIEVPDATLSKIGEIFLAASIDRRGPNMAIRRRASTTLQEYAARAEKQQINFVGGIAPSAPRKESLWQRVKRTFKQS